MRRIFLFSDGFHPGFSRLFFLKCVLPSLCSAHFYGLYSLESFLPRQKFIPPAREVCQVGWLPRQPIDYSLPAPPSIRAANQGRYSHFLIGNSRSCTSWVRHSSPGLHVVSSLSYIGLSATAEPTAPYGYRMRSRPTTLVRPIPY